MKISNARYGFQFEQAEQFTDTLVGVECDLSTEVNQKRSIARRLEMGAVDPWCRHWNEWRKSAVRREIFPVILRQIAGQQEKIREIVEDVR